MPIRRDATHRPAVQLTARIRALCEQQKALLREAEGALSADDRAELTRRIDKVDDFAFSIECDEVVGAGYDDYLADMEP